jgi:uncharacterized protein involved in outer membrane biogenesis
VPDCKILKGQQMRLIREQVEKRMSAMLGAEVSFEKLNLSLLAGTIDAQGVKIQTGTADPPLLTVRRLKAEVSLAAALKKELVIRSLTIENPVVYLSRSADGQLNLPQKPASDTSRQTTDRTTDTNATEEQPSSWRFEAKKVLVVDGRFTFRDENTGYHVLIEPVLVELKESGGGFEFTLMADRASRQDQPADIGSLRLHGQARDVPTPLQWQKARIIASLQAGELLRGQVDVASLQPLELKAQLNGTIVVSDVLRLLPGLLLKSIAGFNPAALVGRVDLVATASYSATYGLRIPELSLHGADLSLPKV